jgi:Fic family protein
MLLMFDLNERVAGVLRSVSKVNVRVGARICPEHTEVNKLLKQWFKKYGTVDFCKDLSKKKKEEAIKQAHIEFEGIHPYEDGNGRIGRMLLNWHRLQSGLAPLIIHTGAEQQEYYKWFRTQEFVDAIIAANNNI